MSPLTLLKSISIYARIAHDPNKLNLVFDLRDTGTAQLPLVEALAVEMRKLPGAAEAFAQRRRLGSLTVEQMLAYPEGSLGRAYGEFMQKHNLSPSSLRVPAGETDGQYIGTHLVETHDLWHVLTGFGADLAGEAGVQAFYASQHTDLLPSALISAILLNAALDFSPDKSRTAIQALACGFSMGRTAKTVFGFDWNANFARPLADVRAGLNILPAVGEARAARAILPSTKKKMAAQREAKFVYYAQVAA
jgi:ubiquinone biosynthesis protein COQ4